LQENTTDRIVHIAAPTAQFTHCPMTQIAKKRKPSQKTERATYAERLEGIFSKKTTKSKHPSGKKSNNAYPIKKNMILFETLNKIHAALST